MAWLMRTRNYFFQMRYLLMLSLFVFLAFSCRKDQRKINRIEGKWTVRWAELPGAGQIEPDMVFKFDWCKARFDDFCDFSAHDFATGITNEGVYHISRDGNTLTLNWPQVNSNHFETFTIDRLNFRTLLLTNTNDNTTYFKRMRLRSMD